MAVKLKNTVTVPLTPAECRDDSGVQCPSEFFFCGCAWGCAFYIGVYRAILERWGSEHIRRHCRIAGNSSGALLGLAMALHKSPEKMEEIYELLIRYANKYGVFGKMSIYHDQVIDLLIDGDRNAYQRCNGRLFVGITRFPGKYHLISQWQSNQDLRTTLHNSMHIPFYMTNIDRTCNGRGPIAIDGCFSNLYHKFSSNTLVISPFQEWMTADVCCGLPNSPDFRLVFSSFMSDVLSFFQLPPPLSDSQASRRYSQRRWNKRRLTHPNSTIRECSDIDSINDDNSDTSDWESDLSNLSLMNCFQNDERGYRAMKNVGYARMMAWDGHYVTKKTRNVPRFGAAMLAFFLRMVESLKKYHSFKCLLFSLVYTVYLIRRNQRVISQLRLY